MILYIYFTCVSVLNLTLRTWPPCKAQLSTGLTASRKRNGCREECNGISVGEVKQPNNLSTNRSPSDQLKVPGNTGDGLPTPTG